MTVPFWESKTLAEMSDDEWESLCDGCAQCCLHKLEDESTGEVYYTHLACRLLDTETARCKNYKERFNWVSDCLKIRLQDIDEFHWLPRSCAYRSLSEGRGLAQWHPLISGNRNTVHEQGISVRGKAIPEQFVPEAEWEEHIIHWVEL